MPGSHVRATVSPQPYVLVQRTIYHCDPRRGSNNFLSYHHTYKCSYNKLQGRITTYAHVFQFWYFGHISAVVQTHQSGYSSFDRTPRALQPPLTASYHLIPIKSYRGVSDFPIGIFDNTITPTHKNHQTIQHFYNAKGVYSPVVYR